MALGRLGTACIVLVACIGCANVKVHKVSVCDRVHGTDEHVKGFRYYLSRPYIVVGRRIPVGTSYIPAALGMDPHNGEQPYVLVSLIGDADGQHLVYNLQGEPVGALTKSIHLVPGSLTSNPGKSSGSPPASAADTRFQVMANATIAELTALFEAQFPMNEKVAHKTLLKVLEPKSKQLDLEGEEARLEDMFKIVSKSLWQGDAIADKKRAELIRFGLSKLLAGPDNTANSWEIILASAVGLRIGMTVLPKDVSVTKPEEFLHELEKAAMKELPKKGATEEARIVLALKNVRSQLQEIANDHGIVEVALPESMQSDLLVAFEGSDPKASGKESETPGDTNLPVVAFAARADTKPANGADGDKTKASTSAPEPDAIQVVFLPDFEEQYAIRNKNILAKTKYQYIFRNGTELASISGSYNSTDVPVAIVETVGSLIKAAGEVAKTAIGNPAALAGAKSSLTGRDETIEQFYIKSEYFIEPGIYRLQKSWEEAAGAAVADLDPDERAGLFSRLGLDVAPVASVLTPGQYEAETKPPESQSPGSK